MVFLRWKKRPLIRVKIRLLIPSILPIPLRRKMCCLQRLLIHYLKKDMDIGLEALFPQEMGRKSTFNGKERANPSK